MGGCTMPVVINSGNENQGMTASLPVIAFARHLQAGKDKLYRALALSNLTAIHLKEGLGKLSAYCGAVSAAAGAGITYLHSGDFDTICHTITNTLGNVSGIVCDGAKASCTAKIASAVDAALLGHYMAMESKAFRPGEGLIAENIEKIIANISRMGRNGMRSTNLEILNIMIGN